MVDAVNVITNADDHASAVARLKKLILADREEDAALMDALALLIEDYERKAFPIPAADPILAILFCMAQEQLSRADLARRTQIGRGHISEILLGKRALSLNAVRAFHEELQIPLEILFMVSSRDRARQHEVG